MSCAPPTSTNCQAFWRNPITLSLPFSLPPSTCLTVSLLLSFCPILSVVQIEMRLVRPLVVIKQTSVIDGQLIQSDPVELLTSHYGSFVGANALFNNTFWAKLADSCIWGIEL